MKQLIATVALIAFAAVPVTTFAAQDESQRQMTQRLQQQQLHDKKLLRIAQQGLEPGPLEMDRLLHRPHPGL